MPMVIATLTETPMATAMEMAMVTLMVMETLTEDALAG